jgi:thymidylate synthase
VDGVAVIQAETAETAYLQALRLLASNRWEHWNLAVQIGEPTRRDRDVRNSITQFVSEQRLLGPHKVATTIFPSVLWKCCGSRHDLYQRYVETYAPHYRSWGSYFGRMIRYETASGDTVNQLEGIIGSVLRFDRTHRTAYTVVIQQPGSETRRPRGGPCLNYLALQLEGHQGKRTMNLLAVYRNHCFLNRAYGNYCGLSDLLQFMAGECEAQAGCLTCISSHAYIDAKKTAVRDFLESLA